MESLGKNKSIDLIIFNLSLERSEKETELQEIFECIQCLDLLDANLISLE